MNTKEKKLIISQTLMFYRKITLANKKRLFEIIKSRNLSKESLHAAVSQLTPSLETAAKVIPGMNEDAYFRSIKVVSDAIYNMHHSTYEEHKQNATTTVEVVVSLCNLKEQHKEDCEKLVKYYKIGFTEEEFEQLTIEKKAANISSYSSFIKQTYHNNLLIRGDKTDKVKSYFDSTKEAIVALKKLNDKLLEVNTLDEEGQELLGKLTTKIIKLEKDIKITRNLAIDSHNQSTIRTLALHYMTSDQIKKLYKEKIDLEEKRNQ